MLRVGRLDQHFVRAGSHRDDDNRVRRPKAATQASGLPDSVARTSLSHDLYFTRTVSHAGIGRQERTVTATSMVAASSRLPFGVLEEATIATAIISAPAYPTLAPGSACAACSRDLR
jgi:hypothetical protein